MPGSEGNVDLPAVILRQLRADPQLPRQNPTVSLWQATPNPHVGSVQSPILPRQVDYAVIGSGVAACGVTRSLLTHCPDGKVGVFEARGLCSGATGRNGGQLTRLPPTRHTFMVENFGKDQAKKAMRLTVKGLDEMHRLAESQGSELLSASKKTRLEKFFAYYDEQSWVETLEAIKLYEEEVPEDRGVYQLVTKEETGSKYGLNGAFGGLRFPAGVVSPYNLITGTFKALLDKHGDRLTIETNTPVEAIHHSDRVEGHSYVLKTPRGDVRARHVVHCTNGHAAHLLPGLRGKMYPRRGTMSVQYPGPSFPDMRGKQSWSFYFTPDHDPMVGDAETGRYYGFQNIESGDLWIGGDRDGIDGFISADDPKIDGHAEKNLRKVLPKLFSRDWVRSGGSVRGIWTGIMCYTGDQLPFVGRLPRDATGRSGSGEWIAAGWNTYGMTNGLICGDALGKMILGINVSSYFPEAYLVSKERLEDRRLAQDAVLDDYFVRLGAPQYAGKRLDAKL